MILQVITAQAASLSAACALDMIFGDPDFPLHPIRLIGALISVAERLMRSVFPKNKTGEIAGGFFTVLIVLSVSAALPLALLYLAYKTNFILGIAAETVICYFMLSARSLAKAGMSVYAPLANGDTEAARKNVSMIVGRDTNQLDDKGIARAAVETVAENTSDGVTAPLLYMAIGGAVLGCVYKAVNTMDSMLGYKNDKYINFGKTAARLDDVLNFMPSRIAAVLMILSSYLLHYDGANAARIHKRDSRNHSSPNSAQTESVCAGALRIRLGGDAYYFGKLVKKPFIGDALCDIKYEDILRSVRLMYMTSLLSAVMFIGVKFAAAAIINFVKF